MKILFKNTTKYTKENTNSLVEFHANKYGKREFIKTILYAVAFMYILIFNIICKNWFLVLGAILLSIIIYFIEKNIKIKCRRQFERLKYFQLHKIFETEEFFFLYLDEKNSLILSKEGFEVGTAKGFSKFIKNKCPFKYRIEENK